MANDDTKFKPGQNNRRGKGKRTVVIEALREAVLGDITEDSSPTEVERAWFKHLAKEAMDPDSSNSGLCLKLITDRGWAALKATSEMIEFDFDEDASPVDKANQVLAAVANGQIPLDYGVQLVGAIKSTIEIEMSTDIKARLEEIEAKLGLS